MSVIGAMVVARMIEAVGKVEAMIVVVGIGAIAAATAGIAGIRELEGSDEADGSTGDEIAAVIAHIDGFGGFRRHHGVGLERQQAGVGHVQRARGDNCCRQYASAFPHVLTLPAYDDSRSGIETYTLKHWCATTLRQRGLAPWVMKVFSRCPPSGCGAAPSP